MMTSDIYMIERECIMGAEGKKRFPVKARQFLDYAYLSLSFMLRNRRLDAIAIRACMRLQR
jgi:hypothetical protein